MADTRANLQNAVRWYRNGQIDRAEAECRALVAADPRNAAALDVLGLIARDRGQPAAAVELFGRAIAAAPSDAVLHLHRGTILRMLAGCDEDALKDLTAAVSLDPKLAEAHHQLGNVLKAMGRFTDAVERLTVAANLDPKSAAIWLNLGVARLELDRAADAVASFRQAVALAPNRPEAHNILGVALLQQGDTAGAEKALGEALRLKPAYAAAHNNLARVYRTQGRIDEAIREFRSAVAVAPEPATHSNLLYTLNFSVAISPEEIFAEHARFGEAHAERFRATWPPPASDFTATRKLRVGFVSADFVNHAVAYFFETVAESRDRSAFELHCYSDVVVPDRVTERLRELSDGWRDTRRLTDDQLAALIREDRIDILVDLAGHTGRNRLLVFARKPAPVQVTWLGYPNTTGLRAIDYRIVDALTDPPGATERWHSETLARLPESFLCYRPPAESPAVNVLPAISTGGVTFGSFSNFAKISAPCFEVWAKVLKRVAGSKLVLKSRGLGDAATAKRIRDRFESLDVEGARVVLDAELTSVTDHLALYHGIDVALDPFPYNGTTTTCEALWMGVPVVTLAGVTHVARVGVSLLTNLGVIEWIAESPQQYVETCAALVSNLPQLAAVRAGLRERMRRSPICDAPRFMRHFEAALREMGARGGRG